MDARKHDEMRLESQAWLMDIIEKHKRYWMGMRWDDGGDTGSSTEREDQGAPEGARSEADILSEIGRQLSENS